MPRRPPAPAPKLTDRLQLYWPFLAGAAAAALLVLVVVAAIVGSAPVRQVEIPTLESVPLEGNQHVPVGTATQYRSYPPASGTHYPIWARYGFYEREIPEGEWIHNLEHGAIVVLYNCEGGPTGCPELVQQLKEVYATFPPGKYGEVKMVITPYTRMQHQLAVVAWGWRATLDEFDRDQILSFYTRFVDRGPEDVP